MNYQLHTFVCLEKIIQNVPFLTISFYMRMKYFNKSTSNGSLRVTWKKFSIRAFQAHKPIATVAGNSRCPAVAPWRNSSGTGPQSPLSSIRTGAPCSGSLLSTGHTCRKRSLTGARLPRICFTRYFGQHLTPKGSQPGILAAI